MPDRLWSTNGRFELVLHSADGHLQWVDHHTGRAVTVVPPVAPTPIPPDPTPLPPGGGAWTEDQLRAWRGAITMLVPELPYGLLFTAQGYDSTFDADQRALARQRYREAGYTHWAYGPLLQKAYHGWWSDTDFRDDPTPFLDKAEELVRDSIIPCLFLLDDQGVYASEHGGVNREAVERDLTPLYAGERWQKLFPIVVLGWEPHWRTDDIAWAAVWARRTFPSALVYYHSYSNHGAPGEHSDFSENGGAYPDEASMWNAVLPHIHGFAMQETWTFTGDSVEDGRTRAQQFEYDLLDKMRRFTYGRGPNAPSSGYEVDRWNATRGTSTKGYQTWDGAYLTTCAADRPCDVVAFEYASYVIKTATAAGDTAEAQRREAEAKTWGQIALTVPRIAGFGDHG